MSIGDTPEGDPNQYPGYGPQPGYGYGPPPPGYGYGPAPGPGGPGYGYGYGYGGYGPPPSNFLVWAILTTIFCFLPAGIVSIVYASQVNSKWHAGDFQGAQNSSNNAKIWAIISAVAAVVLFVGIIILFAVIGVAASKMTSVPGVIPSSGSLGSP